ncbi:MAG: hypothetical protein Q9163_004158 [Psora crenata]
MFLAVVICAIAIDRDEIVRPNNSSGPAPDPSGSNSGKEPAGYETALTPCFDSVSHPKHKTLDVITQFHRASVPSSIRVNTLLKQLSADASETATQDHATSNKDQNKVHRTEFELNITEDAPTSDQLRTILEYVGARKASQLVDGARDEADALKKLKEDPGKFKPPVANMRSATYALGADVVTVVGDNETELKKMISQIPKETNSV